MNLKYEILPFIDGNGLVAPNLVPIGTIRASDNGPMYTNEYYIMLNRNKALIDKDLSDYNSVINPCIGSDGELHRAPGDSTPDEVDDYYGAYAGLVELNLKPTFKLPIRLWRQPQLLLAFICANGAIPLYAYPLEVIAALVIATSCINAPLSDADSRRLSWLLVQATKKSKLCQFAAKIWYRRLYNDYGLSGMKAVACLYYKDNHPFTRYWIDV